MIHGTIKLPFGNAEYDFNVAKHKQLFELQDRCGLKAKGAEGESILIPSGLPEIFARLTTSRWRAADVIEPLRLGLIGGGLSVGESLKLMSENVDHAPLAMWAPHAATIIATAMYGVAGDDLGKAKAEGTETGAEISASSAPPNTEPALPSGSRRAKSTK